MKAILLYLSLLFTLSAEPLQAQCLQNPDFAEYCGTTFGLCPYFNNPCVPGWFRSHGSPQIFTFNPASANQAYMWAANGNGEGMFAPYSFVSGKMYNITIRANATGGAGSLRLYATQNLSESPNGPCGEAPPTLSSFQQIPVTLLVGQGWKEYSITFTANSSYTQLLIYPFMAGLPQLNLYVDYIKLCPAECAGTITYNSGTIPTGETTAKYILAGSSAGTGGSGTVTISSTATTRFKAGTEIQLLPEFSAQVTGSGEFSAEIVTANCSEPGGGASLVRPTQPAKEVMGKTALQLYPNPVRDVLTAEIFMEQNDPVEIKVLNLTGQVMRTMKNPASSATGIQRIHISLAGLPNGTYFVQVISKKGSQVRKIEKLE